MCALCSLPWQGRSGESRKGSTPPRPCHTGENQVSEPTSVIGGKPGSEGRVGGEVSSLSTSTCRQNLRGDLAQSGSVSTLLMRRRMI